jgi:hypothetical protein
MTTLTRTGRTDRHAPASPEFDPQKYDCAYFVDLHVTDGTRKAWNEYKITVLKPLGYEKAPHAGADQCGHCGAHLRFAAVLTIENPREWIFVGEECLDNRFDGMSKSEFQRLRKNAELNRERTRKAEKIARLIEENPDLVWITYLPNISDLNWSNFLQDMHTALIVRGDMSPAQRNAAIRSIDKLSAKHWEREAEKLAALASKSETKHVGTVGEKVKVTGKVTHVFAGQPYAYYGPTPYTYVMDCDGNSVKFTTTGASFTQVSSGDVLTVSGTVKACNTYRDNPQTVLTRVKVTA